MLQAAMRWDAINNLSLFYYYYFHPSKCHFCIPCVPHRVTAFCTWCSTMRNHQAPHLSATGIQKVRLLRMTIVSQQVTFSFTELLKMSWCEQQYVDLLCIHFIFSHAFFFFNVIYGLPRRQKLRTALLRTKSSPFKAWRLVYSLTCSTYC